MPASMTGSAGLVGLCTVLKDIYRNAQINKKTDTLLQT